MKKSIIKLDGAFIFQTTENNYIAGTSTKSKDFKTLKGAAVWLWRNCRDTKKPEIKRFIQSL